VSVGEVFGQLLPIGVAIAISPLPIVAVVLMLATPRGRVNGPAFVLAWVVGLALVGTIVIVLAGDGAQTDTGAPSTGISWLKLVIGVGLIALGVRQFRGRPRDGEHGDLPRWMTAVDAFGWPKALGAGLVLSAANPKNLLLAIAGAAVIAQAGLSGGQEAASLAIFVLIGTVGVAAPLVLYFAMGARSRELLDGLRAWMAAHNAVIMAILLILIGAKILGDAISGFSA
jgi:threonine/homoserine/homoserine lactone efflux protein